MSQKSCYYVLYSSYFYATGFFNEESIFTDYVEQLRILSNEAEDDMKNYAGQGGYYHPR